MQIRKNLLVLSGNWRPVLNILDWWGGVDGGGGDCGGDGEKQNFYQRGEEEPLVPQGPGPGATKLSDR